MLNKFTHLKFDILHETIVFLLVKKLNGTKPFSTYSIQCVENNRLQNNSIFKCTQIVGSPVSKLFIFLVLSSEFFLLAQMQCIYILSDFLYTIETHLFRTLLKCRTEHKLSQIGQKYDGVILYAARGTNTYYIHCLLLNRHGQHF